MEIKIQVLKPVSLEYSLVGPDQRPVIAFVHGFGSNLRQFLKQADYFSKEYRVLLFSLRGHGGSGRPVTENKETYAPRALAGDALRLLDSLNIGKVHWIGHCLGGLVGYEFFRKAKERLLSLATFGTALVSRYDPLTISALNRCRNMIIRFRGYPALCRMIGRASSREREVQAEVAALMEKASPQALHFAQINMGRYNYLQVLEAMRIPVLLLRPEQDREINLHLGSAMETLYGNPRNRFVDLAAAGHFANLDRPEQFNATIEQWLG